MHHGLYKLVPKRFHGQIEMISHVRDEQKMSIENKLKEAERLLKKYAQAKLVITSRIHCALPCLALGTSVIFFDFGYVRKKNRNRFGGILELMHSIRPVILFHENRRIDKFLKLFGFHRLFYPLIKPLNIDWDNPPENPSQYLKIAKEIKQDVINKFSEQESRKVS